MPRNAESSAILEPNVVVGGDLKSIGEYADRDVASLWTVRVPSLLLHTVGTVTFRQLIGADPYGLIRYTCSYTAKAQHDLRATTRRLSIRRRCTGEKDATRAGTEPTQRCRCFCQRLLLAAPELASACYALSKSTVCPLTQTAFDKATCTLLT